MMPKCQFIGIGVQKSASTWVHRILEDHPEIISSNPKELDFFSFNYDKGENWYHSHFNGFGEEKKESMSGEISPSYFNDLKAPTRVHSYNPDIKIIVTLRDPLERAYSNHLHLIREELYKFDDISFEYGTNHYPEYIDQSFYFKHLSNWFKLFPKQNFLILLQEDIRRDPVGCSIQVYQFLGIDEKHQSQFLNRQANVSFKPKSRILDTFYKSTSSFLTKIGLQKFVKLIKKQSFFISLRDKNRVHLSKSVPEISPETKRKVMDKFSDDLVNLSSLIERDSFPWETWRYIKEHKEN